MSTSPEQGNVFTLCTSGPKCALKYFQDWQRRVAERGAEGQGTGDRCKDLEAVASAMGLQVTAVPSSCLDMCPLPWDRSMLIDPLGQGHMAYYDDLPALLREFHQRG